MGSPSRHPLSTTDHRAARTTAIPGLWHGGQTFSSARVDSLRCGPAPVSGANRPYRGTYSEWRERDRACGSWESLT